MRTKPPGRAWPAIWLSVVLALAGTACRSAEESDATFSTAAKLPFGTVDVPVDNETLEGRVPVEGWALAGGGIHQVVIYVDGEFVTIAKFGNARPDVTAVHPGLPDSPAAGWKVTLDTTGWPRGHHELVVQAQSKDGASRDIGDITVITK
jgi:hypothetical protein